MVSLFLRPSKVRPVCALETPATSAKTIAAQYAVKRGICLSPCVVGVLAADCLAARPSYRHWISGGRSATHLACNCLGGVSKLVNARSADLTAVTRESALLPTPTPIDMQPTGMTLARRPSNEHCITS